MFMSNHLIGFGAFSSGATQPATSYANTGGSGNRSGVVTPTTTLTLDEFTIAKIVDGDTSSGYFSTDGGAVAGLYIRFDFGSAKYIDEMKFYANGTANHGTWKWQGSADASSWSDIGSSFTLAASAAGAVDTSLAAQPNYSGFRYYQLLGVSGNTNGGAAFYEMEFKISA